MQRRDLVVQFGQQLICVRKYAGASHSFQFESKVGEGVGCQDSRSALERVGDSCRFLAVAACHVSLDFCQVRNGLAFKLI